MAQISFEHNGAERMVTIKEYDRLQRLTEIRSTPSASPALAYRYDYNLANQRVRAILEDGSRWDYAYDALGQVISGSHLAKDGTPVVG